MSKITDVKIEASSGHFLAISQYFPNQEPIGAVIIASAMCVPKTFYSSLANWLTEQDFFVTTFDLRGVGDSKFSNLSTADLDFHSWISDYGKVLDLVLKTTPDLPITWIGHSLGGQLVPLITSSERIAQVITIATGTGYWFQNSAPTRWRAWALWHIFVPIFTPLFGYFPGSRLKMVGDLPKGIIYQWGKWCRHPAYLIGVEASDVRTKFETFIVPLTSISFTDDEMMSEKNVLTFLQLFKSAKIQNLRLNPRDYGIKKIGHFNFFRRGLQDKLWKLTLLHHLRTS